MWHVCFSLTITLIDKSPSHIQLACARMLNSFLCRVSKLWLVQRHLMLCRIFSIKMNNRPTQLNYSTSFEFIIFVQIENLQKGKTKNGKKTTNSIDKFNLMISQFWFSTGINELCILNELHSVGASWRKKIEKKRIIAWWTCFQSVFNGQSTHAGQWKMRLSSGVDLWREIVQRNTRNNGRIKLCVTYVSNSNHRLKQLRQWQRHQRIEPNSFTIGRCLFVLVHCRLLSASRSMRSFFFSFSSSRNSMLSKVFAVRIVCVCVCTLVAINRL